MSRKATISIESLTAYGLEPTVPIDINSDDYTPDNTPYSGLLWAEIYQLINKAHLSVWQALVFEWFVRGLSLSEIAELLQRSKSTIQVHLSRAINKIEKVPHIGLLTVLVESQGWNAVSEHLNNKRKCRTL